MGKKILYITTIGDTMSFFETLVAKLVKDGNTVDIACNDEADDVPVSLKELGCKIYHIDCSRSPLKKGNLDAIRQIRKIVSENDYEIVHCHTPIAAACTRMACKKFRKNGVKVYYTAHGFHFYKGAPLKNWLMFYPVEKKCAKYTDVLITINKQDLERAKKKFKAGSVEYVPGVGLDTKRFAETECDVNAKRKEIGIPEDAYLILSVGELNANKNHESVIRALANLGLIKEKNVHYVIAGVGDNDAHLMQVAAKLGIADRVHLLGFRRDVAELFKCADMFIHPSFREGLPVSVMEAMASGIAVTGSNIRGCQDLVEEKYLFDPKDINSIKRVIEDMINSDKNVASLRNMEFIKAFDIDVINKQMYALYEV